MKAPAWRICAFALVILVGIAVVLPSFVPRDGSRVLLQTAVALGLDLRGGASPMLRADEKALAAKMLSEARGTLTDGGSALLVTPSLNDSVDFRGGARRVTPFDMAPEIATLRVAKEHRPSSKNTAARSHRYGDQTMAGATALHVGYGAGCSAELCHTDGFSHRDDGRILGLRRCRNPAFPERPSRAPCTDRSFRSPNLAIDSVKPVAWKPSWQTNESTAPCSTQPRYSQDSLRSA